MPSSSSELAQIEKAQQVLERMLGFDMDSLQRSNIYRKLGDSCLEMLEYRRDQQLAERAVSCYERALQSYTADSHPILWARTMRDLGFAYAACAGARCLRRAVSCWEQALAYSSPQECLCIQEGLARSRRRLAETENRMENAALAATACQEALRLCSKERSPLQYAGLMAELASSYLMLARRRDDCKKAIDAIHEALQLYTADSHPQQYASLQNNLAIAYLSLAEIADGEGDGADEGPEDSSEGGRGDMDEAASESRAWYCRMAIAACEEALIYRTAEEHPLAYAATENNLGDAYFALSECEEEARDVSEFRDEAARSLQKAHEAFTRALQIYCKESHPRQYATTQSNLANVYLALGGGDDPNSCLKAIRAAEEALSVFTLDESPEDYAEAQGTLWLAYLTLADYELPAENCALALDACRARLRALRASGRQDLIASCCKDLAITATMMAEMELSAQAKAEDCRSAISAANEALRLFDSARYPLEHAGTQMLLWAAYSALADVKDGPINCSKAITACRAAISIYEDRCPAEHADARKSLGYSLITLAEMKGGAEAAECCEKAIESYLLALDYYTLEAHPIDHADIMREMAYAHVALAKAGTGEVSSKRALKAYTAAQKIYQRRALELEKEGAGREAALLREKANRCLLSMQSCRAIIKAARKREGTDKSRQTIASRRSEGGS